VDRLAVRPLLDGHRSAPAGDLESLVDVLVRFSELVVDQTSIVSADLNPVIVGPGSAVAVDALVSWA
jgi:acetyltransferase